MSLHLWRAPLVFPYSQGIHTEAVLQTGLKLCLHPELRLLLPQSKTSHFETTVSQLFEDNHHASNKQILV